MQMNATGLIKKAHILPLGSLFDEFTRFRVVYLRGCIQVVSAKFGSFAVENRFRQPASPLLTGSDSSQQKIHTEKRNTNGNRNSEVV